MPTLSEIVKQNLGAGWSPTSPFPQQEQDTIKSNLPGEPDSYGPTGRWVVYATDGKGGVRKVAVQPPPSAQSNPVEAMQMLNDPNSSAWSFSGVEDMVKAPASNTQIVKGPSGSQIAVNPDNPSAAVTVVPQDPNEVAQAGLDLATNTAVWDDLRKNVLAGKGLLTSKQLADLDIQRTQNNLTQAQIDQRKAELAQKNQLDMMQETRLAPLTAAQAQLTGAQATGTGVETQVNQEKLNQLIASAPANLRDAMLKGDLTDLQIQQVKQAMTAPTVTTEGPYVTKTSPTGEVSQSQMNLAYVPKTQAEIAARVGQIQAAARAKQQEVMSKVDAITDPAAKAEAQQQALKDFQGWWDQNVAPQTDMISAAQADAQRQAGVDEAKARQDAYQQALGAGTQQLDAFKAAAPYRVGPNYASNMEKIFQSTMKGEKANVDMAGSLGWKGPDPAEQARQATQEALKYISPGAAQATGTPQQNWQGVNVADALNFSKWAPSFGQPGAPAPAGAAGPAAAPGPSGPQQQINTAAASFQNEAASNQFGNPNFVAYS